MCLALFAARDAESAAAENKSLLLRIRLTQVSELFGLSSTVESFIFRDGLVVERGSDSENRCWITRAAGTHEMLVDLQEVLTEHRIGLQAGNCQIKEPVDNFLAERRVTWFGRRARQNSYTTGNGLPDPCPDETLEIDRAIRFYLANAEGAQTTFVPCSTLPVCSVDP